MQKKKIHLIQHFAYGVYAYIKKDLSYMSPKCACLTRYRAPCKNKATYNRNGNNLCHVHRNKLCKEESSDKKQIIFEI